MPSGNLDSETPPLPGLRAIQIRNLLNRKPATGHVYNDFTRSVEKVVSFGILPLISYKVEF